jgi:hypothetical protein
MRTVIVGLIKSVLLTVCAGFLGVWRGMECGRIGGVAWEEEIRRGRGEWNRRSLKS